MTTFKSSVTPNLNFVVLAGNCLAMAQGIVGAPVLHDSATDAANATQYRHADYNIPDAVCVLWFDHWGTYGPRGQEVYGNWGHVVVYVPGRGYASSSPYAGEWSAPYFYSSIAEVEQTFNCSFRFWTEDINGLRVCSPVEVKPIAWEDTMYNFSTNVKRTKAQEIPAETQRRVLFNDKGDISFAFGPGDVVGMGASVRLGGKPGGRVEVTIVRDTVSADGKTITKTERIAQERDVFDDLNLVGLNLGGSCALNKNQRLRILVQGSKSAGTITVHRAEVNGYARAGA